jgi:crossover junction endodeoxyribonuclease RusA
MSDSDTIAITLPFPPSVNTYYRSFRGRNILSKKGREYRVAVAQTIAAIGFQPPPRLAGRLDVRVTAYPPDRRRRDLDNLFKGILDALEKEEIFLDDNQIDHLEITRGEIIKPGSVHVIIKETDSGETLS